jgi:hypothetical protein
VSEEEQEKCKKRWEKEQRRALKESRAERGVKRVRGDASKHRDATYDGRAEGSSRIRGEAETKQEELDQEAERTRNRHEYTELELARRREKQKKRSSKGKGKRTEPETKSAAPKITIPVAAMSRIAGKYDALGL